MTLHSRRYLSRVATVTDAFINACGVRCGTRSLRRATSLVLFASNCLPRLPLALRTCMPDWGMARLGARASSTVGDNMMPSRLSSPAKTV
eukprot:1462207-Amphidinium_carterae.2